MQHRRHIKQGLLEIARPLWPVTSWLCRNRLQILCYHGFAMDDEAHFWPQMFITQKSFADRLAFLARERFTVLALGEALTLLEADRLPPRAAVITIDDAFYDVKAVAWPLLKRYQFPATVYVPTYYVLRQSPVLRVALRYLLWKSPCGSVDLNQFGIDGVSQTALGDRAQRARLSVQFYKRVCALENETVRESFCKEVARVLQVDYDALAHSRKFSLLSSDELIALQREGLDLQLHTHRHTFPSNNLGQARREIEENRAALTAMGVRNTEHFCYPSGEWSNHEWELLVAMGIKSATTCDRGMNHRSVSPMALYRFLDGENFSQLDFESEMFGVSEIGRMALRWAKLRRDARKAPP